MGRQKGQYQSEVVHNKGAADNDCNQCPFIKEDHLSKAKGPHSQKHARAQHNQRPKAGRALEDGVGKQKGDGDQNRAHDRRSQHDPSKGDGQGQIWRCKLIGGGLNWEGLE